MTPLTNIVVATSYGARQECMHASIACLLLYEDYVWVSLGNVMKAKRTKAKQSNIEKIECLAGAGVGVDWTNANA